VSTPCRACVSFFFFGVPTSLPEKLGAEERLGLNLKDLRSWKKNCPGMNPSNQSDHPGRVTLGFLNIPAASDRVNPSEPVDCKMRGLSRGIFAAV
jgi:hypothetical protein